jgi:hypothetical protein
VDSRIDLRSGLGNVDAKMKKQRESSLKKSNGIDFVKHGTNFLSPSRSIGSSISISQGSLSSRSIQSLPSLSFDSIQSKPLTELEFAATTPIFRRNKYDLFGMDGKFIYFRSYILYIYFLSICII